ncbi:hypothetical protein [Roseburia inulinivorans]
MCRAFEEWQEECIQKGVATGIILVKWQISPAKLMLAGLICHLLIYQFY